MRDILTGDLIWRSVTVQLSLAENLPQVLGDFIQLQQVLLNLILNACDAMAANPSEDRRLNLATAYCDGAVRVSVSDTGCGQPKEAERVFEPFYTTKKQGLGLGLSICTSIVRAHKGRLWGETHPAAEAPNGAVTARAGATFHLELPEGGQP